METNKCIIIAEAGVNHNGDINIAKKLINQAVLAGVDFIKFQTFKTELNISKQASKADYQKLNTANKTETQYEMVQKLELGFEKFSILKQYCDEKGVGFLSTGFDFPSIDFLDTLGLPFFKIPSGEIINKPYLEYVAKKGRPIILSTGMSTLHEIQNAIDIFTRKGLTRDQIIVLHCNTEYPTPFSDVNLRAMQTIREICKVKTGYSDHTLGIEIPIAAATMGAVIIEKHFTLNRKMDGPDHRISLEPEELLKMVTAIRHIEAALGDGIKKPSPSEIKNIQIVRRSIHYAKNLKKGGIISEDDLIMKRPGNGISPMELENVLSKKLKIDVLADSIVKWEDLE